MPSFTLTLNHFIEPVPVCEITASTQEILTLLQLGQHETIVVVSQQGHPLGIVHFQQLLSQLPEPWQRFKEFKRATPSFNLKSLMQPIATLPAQLEVEKLRSRLQGQHQPYALIDEGGKFLGLLDSWSLLKSLLSFHQDENVFSLDATVQDLLEQLPLPIMLCSARQQVIYQNQHWQEQIDESVSLTAQSSHPQDGHSLSSEAMPNPASVHPSSSEEGMSEATISRRWESELFGFRQPTTASERSTEFPYASLLFSHPRQALKPQLVRKTDRDPDLSDERLEAKFPSLLKSSKTGLEKVWRLLEIPLQLITGDSYPQTSLTLVLATDITLQQECRQELAVKNADLVHLNRLKDEFLACISHELKSPLTAVVGLSSLLKEQKIGELNSRQVRYAELIHRSGRQLMTLVNDILDLTRLESGQLKLTTTLVSIPRVCEQAYHSIEEKYKAKIEREIDFSLEIEPGLERLVADRQRLVQMLVHLLDNAIKFTDSGGKVGLKVNGWENWLAFTVWDTGIGIPEGSQHLIFQKFQQLESPLTRQFEGAGLGLVLTQRLAKAHGGDISFLSQVGQGSQFTLLLPPQPLSEALDSSVNPSRQRGYPLILVVEVLPEAIAHLTEQLNELGYQVIIARTGTEAIEKARQLQPQRIFLNPTLPLLSGWDVLTLLKSDPQTQKIQAIVTAPAEAQRSSKQKGADGFIALPINRQALQDVLRDTPGYSIRRQESLTILQLCGSKRPANESVSWLDANWKLKWANHLPQLNYRLLEADSLDQAKMIVSVWKVDVLLIDETVAEDLDAYLRSLDESSCLATIPLVTLDTKITEAANQIEGLSVFPCLLPNSENCHEKLLQVIQIATET